MRNADGTTGPHWTYEQAEKLMKQKGIDCDPVIFWVCMNAEYSDRCKVNKDYGVLCLYRKALKSKGFGPCFSTKFLQNIFVKSCFFMYVFVIAARGKNGSLQHKKTKNKEKVPI